MKKIKSLVKIGITLALLGAFIPAQAITLWYLDGTSLKPVDDTWDLVVGEITFDNLIADKITITGASAGNLDMGGFDISNGGTFTMKNLVATSTSALNSFAGKVGIGTTTPAYELDVNGFTNTKSIHEVSPEGLVLGMNFNTETITGSAGSETVLDSSGYNNHGINSGATATSTQGFNGGGAFDFDGTDDYITTGFAQLSGNQTISVWLKSDLSSYPDTDTFKILNTGNTHISLRSTNIRFGTGYNTNRSTSFSSGVWFNITGTHDGTHLRLYKNGILITTLETALVGNSTNVGVIGAQPDNSKYFDGLIDNVQFYNRALSADEIKALYLQRAEVKDSYVSQKDVTVKSTGQVGINKVSPTAMLDVIQTTITGNTGWFYRDLGSASTDSPMVQITNDNAGDDQIALSIQQDGTASALTIDGAGTGYSAIFNNGNVGIGTVSPLSKLTVGQPADKIGLVIQNNFSTNEFFGLGFRGYTGGTGGIKGGIVFERVGGYSYGRGDMKFLINNESNDNNVATSTDAKMVITRIGRVGIGTTSPSSLLGLFSTATTTQTWDSNSATQGSCLKMKDMDGGGYSYITVLNGTMTASQTSCE